MSKLFSLMQEITFYFLQQNRLRFMVIWHNNPIKSKVHNRPNKNCKHVLSPKRFFFWLSFATAWLEYITVIIIFQVRNIMFAIRWWIETLSTSTGFAISLISFKAAADIGSFGVRTKSVGITVIRLWPCTFINICSQKQEESIYSEGCQWRPGLAREQALRGALAAWREKEGRHRKDCSQASRGPKISPSYHEKCRHNRHPLAIKRLTLLSSIIKPRHGEWGEKKPSSWWTFIQVL